MLIKAAIREWLAGDAVLEAGLGQRIYSRFAGQAREYPICVIRMPRRILHSGMDGPGDTSHAVVRLELFDVDGDRLDALARRVEARMVQLVRHAGTPAFSRVLPSEDEGEVEDFLDPVDDSDEVVHATIQTYDVWFTNET